MITDMFKKTERNISKRNAFDLKGISYVCDFIV